MDLSSQLRIILVLAGIVIWAAVYYFGKRRPADVGSRTNVWQESARQVEEPELSLPEVAQPDDYAFDEDELEVPAYMRKQPQGVRFDEFDDLAATDLDDVAEVESIAITPDVRHARDESVVHGSEPIVADDQSDPFTMSDMQFGAAAEEPVAEIESAGERLEPQIEWPHESEVPTIPAVVVESPVPPSYSSSQSTPQRSVSTSEAAPTLSDPVVPVVRPTAKQRSTTIDDKPLSPAARRKIIALRLAMPERVTGALLQDLLHGERLVHGRFNIFHREQDNGTVFSLASMVEPGTFDIEKMPQQQFPGVTLFMLLPGPLDGLIAYDQMLSCAQRLAHATDGVLQDERGTPLSKQVIDRLREEVLDFQHLMSGISEPG